MDGMLLTNDERRYVGLQRIDESWEAVRFDDATWLYVDLDDVIRKQITATEDGYYREVQLRHPTAQDRTVLLPLTGRGRPRKLTAATLAACNPVGPYLLHDHGAITIASFTTQTTFYSTEGSAEDWSGVAGRRRWLDWWIAGSSSADLAAIDAFAEAGRRHCTVGEGDFFAFRVGRRGYGYGRVLMDVRAVLKRLKSGALPGRHYGLRNLMGQPLMIAVYRTIGTDPAPDLDRLTRLGTFPTQAIMDNPFVYGEFPVIGHLPLRDDELEFPISFSRSVDATDPHTVYLQYGLIYRETDTHDLDHHLVRDESGVGAFRNESLGWSILVARDLTRFRDAIKGAADPWTAWPQHLAARDLRHPANQAARREIFAALGLDADRSYAENLAGTT